METQAELRTIKRRARQALSTEEKIQKSTQIAKIFLQTEVYQQADTLSAYLCLPEEVNVKAIIDAAWADGKTVYLPIVLARGKALKFAPYKPETKLTKGALGIDIPDVPNHEYVDAEVLDIVVTPLVAFDANRNRIGMGGGFYDHTFAFKKMAANRQPTLIGVAFEVQRVEGEMKANAWDVRLDMIVSEVNESLNF